MKPHVLTGESYRKKEVVAKVEADKNYSIVFSRWNRVEKAVSTCIVLQRRQISQVKTRVCWYYHLKF